MSPDATDATDDSPRRPTAGVDARSFERYDHVEAEDGCIVYDREVSEAWIQSTVCLALAEHR